MASSVQAPQRASGTRSGAEPVPGYRLVKRLGIGGAGEVWCAEGPGELPVALKLVQLSCKLGGRERENLRILRAIRHPNLLAYFGAWITDELLIIGMELADCSLWEHFHQRTAGRLAGIPLSELLDILFEAARLIDFIHAPKHALDGRSDVAIHHRDIKPQNIMLLGGGVKVADFGLSCLFDRCAKSRSHDGLTYAYAAPEMFRRQISEHSDQYSLAMTYCVLRGGRLPFVGPPASVMYGHLFEPPDLAMLPLPEQSVVHRALSKDAEERWPSCREFVDALRGCRDAGSPETIPSANLDHDEGGMPQSSQPAISGGCSLQMSGGVAIKQSAADDRSSYQLGAWSPASGEFSIAQQSQARTVLLPVERNQQTRSQANSVLLRGAFAFLALLGLACCALRGSRAPTERTAIVEMNDHINAPFATARTNREASRVRLPDLPATVSPNPPPPLESMLNTPEPNYSSATAMVRGVDPNLPAPSPSAGQANAQRYARPRSNRPALDKLRRLQAQAIRLIRRLTLAIGKLRAPALRAVQLVLGEHGRAAPRSAAAQPPPAAALAMTPGNPRPAGSRLRVVLPSTVEIEAGLSQEVPVSADRGGLDGPVVVQIEGLPAGVVASPVTIPAGDDRSVLLVRAELEARSMELKLRVTAQRGSQQTELPITLIVHASPALAYRIQGNQLLANGKPAEAIHAFSRVLELTPGDSIALNNRGVAYTLLGQHESAVADYRAAIRRKPRDFLPRYNRAITYTRHSDFTHAILDFDTAIRLNPSYAPAYRSRAEFHDRFGNPAHAAADRLKADQIERNSSQPICQQAFEASMEEFSLKEALDLPPAPGNHTRAY